MRGDTPQTPRWGHPSNPVGTPLKPRGDTPQTPWGHPSNPVGTPLPALLLRGWVLEGLTAPPLTRIY